MGETPLRRDRATWSLLGSNLLTLALALWQRWPLGLLLWPYWGQSVVIGWYARKRILAAPAYRRGAKPFFVDGSEVRPDEWSQERLAGVFTLHFGLFHLIYLVFLPLLGAAWSETAITGREWLSAMALVVPFALTHAQSHRENVAADVASVPTVTQLMVLPYLRVVPMHLTLIFGVALVAADAAPWAVALFIALKSVLDLVLHRYEHRALQRDGASGGVAGRVAPVAPARRPRRPALTGGGRIERWRSMGCAVIFLLPLLVIGPGIVVIAIRGLWAFLTGGAPESDAPAAVYWSTLIVGILVALVPLAVARQKAGGPAVGPPAEALGPRPGAATSPPGGESPWLEPGRVGRTPIHVELWDPGRSIRLRQRRGWAGRRGTLLWAVSVLTASLAIGATEPAALIFGGWVVAGLLWASLPSRRREVEIDWPRDAVRIRSASSRRELGLSRVRGIEAVEGSEVTRSKIGAVTSVTLWHQLVAWVEPDGLPPIPYLLVHAEATKRDHAAEPRQAVERLAESVAGALGVPPGRPRDGRRDLAPYV